MAEVIRMPRMSDTMEEGVIVEWHKKVGDQVSPGDVLAEVETDKATMELESYQEGTLLYIGPKKGEAIAVDAVLAILGEKGEDYKALLKEEESAPKKETKEEAPETVTEPEKEEAAPTAEPPQVAIETTDEDTGRIKASPLARSMAAELGVDLSKVQGTGDDGRIIKRDVENYKPAAQAAPAANSEAPVKIELPQIVAEESYEEIKVSQMRKTIAKRLSQSKFSAPHFYLTMEINMDRCVASRQAINEYAPIKISFNDIVIKAVATALRKHPMVNSSWLGDTIRINNHIHIGVAVAVDEGLLVPVLRFADNKSLAHIATEVRDLAAKARTRKLQPEEMQGNTFSISNLGMYGIDEFTAIINPPDACILAVGGISDKLVLVDGEVKSTQVMKVTLSCDHRVVDGVTGSEFLQTLKTLLEDPVRILV